MKNVVTSPHRGELCEISSFRVVTPQPTSPVRDPTHNKAMAVTGQENCQDDSSATQEKT